MADLKAVAINVTVLLMFVNGAPNLLIASGVAEDMGIDPSVSGDQPIGNANEELQDIEVSGGFASTLFALYASVTGPVKVLLEVIAGGPIILASVGVPGWLLDFVFLPQYLIIGGTIIYVLAGRRL